MSLSSENPLSSQSELPNLALTEPVSLDEIAAELGPFTVPSAYRFEPELAGTPPRTVPTECRLAPAGIRLRRNAITCLLMGVVCMLSSQLRPVIELSHYLLPLAYLFWIGGGLAVIGALMFISHALVAGPPSRVYAYIKQAQPLVARVLHNRRYEKDAGHGNKRFGFETGVQLLHPETTRVECLWLRSEEIGSQESSRKYEEPYAPGDYVTVVHMPGKLNETARIYSLLGVSATAPYILKNARPWKPGVSFALACAITGLAVSAAGLLVSAIYALEFRSPVEDNGWTIFKLVIPGAVVIGSLCWWLMYKGLRSTGSGAVAIAIFPFLAAVAGGLLGSYVLVTFVNSGFDRSPPEYREFEVVNLWEQTHKGIFRTYEVEYQSLRGGEKHKHPAKFGELEAFGDTMAGVAEMHRGFFGLQWIRRIYPIQVQVERVTESALTSRPGRQILTLRTSSGQGAATAPSEVLAFEFAATLDDGKRVPASPELVRRLLAKAEADERQEEASEERQRRAEGASRPEGNP